jgi:hypothetical protein
MPSKSLKQHNLMEMVAHNPAKAKELKIPQSVGKDFAAADKAKKFGTGGSPKITMGSEQMVNKHETRMGSEFGYKKEVPNVSITKYAGKKEGGLMKKHDDEAQDKKLISKMIKAAEKKEPKGMKKGGSVKGCGIATKGLTKGKMV